jgi:hypothetical protein
MNIPSWAFSGAKVVYVNNGPMFENPVGNDTLDLGEIYTIEWVEYIEDVVWADGTTSSNIFVKLLGVRDVLPPGKHRVEQTYYLARFRPVKTIETDMEEHFQKFLDTQIPADVV